MDAWQVDAFRDLGVGELSDLPVEPAPPADPPEPGVVVLGRFQPVHKGHALMIQAPKFGALKMQAKRGLSSP